MIHIPFDNSYAALPDRFYARQPAVRVAAPALIKFNHDLARDLGIDSSGLTDAEAAALFSGNATPEGADPLAQAYAGHQFGGWSPQLGDGRALLLGEVIAPDGTRHDIQLKGSGRTPFSRSGDGRAWLGPVLREYLMSEAMHAIGVPTTRALAAVRTGETVQRETALPGAVLTRTAASHIRVGTFQFFAARGDRDALQTLTDYTIARHFPKAGGPADLLEQVMQRQADLVAKWMGLGFIHGVMNTDNVSVTGETIDYGPCAMMDSYHPDTVFSTIDQQGRYAYSNQPKLAHWNIAQFATSLVPLMPDQAAAIDRFTAIINRFPDLFAAAQHAIFSAKLGLENADPQLIDDLLALMAQDGADFTNSFAALPRDDARDQFIDRTGFDAWKSRWLDQNPDTAQMARTNPQVIPRLHRIEAAIQAAVAGDDAPFHAMLAAVTQPFTANETFARPPTTDEKVARTFCGT
ncbi:YdiU family protein [Octadecabacter sp. R77987]|uniref:protein adenylyltransferase SelO n=1 Tax=Octadecabacter sp. R77987 TaxID=3093874 RepID=UPI00366BA5BE